MEDILKVKNLNISFTIKKKDIKVIKNLSLNLKKGEILTIVGASGSGKSVFSHALMGILPQNAVISGNIEFLGKTINQKERFEQFALIPQTSSYLDPLCKISNQINLIENDLSQKTRDLYPFQCSGGMLRNAFFSLAYEKNASIIIADEPTPGLDLKTALGILKELEKLSKMGKTVILITHDIDLAIQISDRIAVFFDGTILEIANQEDFANGNLRHPYTKALFDALPQNGMKKCNIPFRLDENICFCNKICDKFTENCKNTLTLKNYNKGMVMCNNVT